MEDTEVDTATGSLVRIPQRRQIVVAGAAGTAVVAAVATLWGASPLWIAIAAGVAWAIALSPWWGLAASTALVTLGWCGVTLLAMVTSPAIPGPFGTAIVVAYVLAGIGAVAVSRRTPTQPHTAQPARAIAWASGIGPMLWGGAVLLASLRPTGGGLSWAVYSDSSTDVWFIRLFADLGGVPAYTPLATWPLEHTLTTAALPLGHVVDGSASAFAAEVTAHAMGWATLIALTCFLAGLVAGSLGSNGSRLKALAPVLAGLVSVGMLMMPATGFLLRVGQINSHLLLALLFCSILIARRAQDRPLPVTGILIVVAGIVTIVWAPFALVPAGLVGYIVIRHRALIKARQREALLWLGGCLAISMLVVSAFAVGELIDVARGQFQTEGGLLEVGSVRPNPVWVPLTLAVMLALVALGVVAWRLRSIDGPIALVTGGGMFIAGTAIAFASTGFDLATEYYPAKFFSLATLAMVPVVIGLAASAVGGEHRAGRWIGASSLAALTVLTLVAPASPHVPKWGFTPWYLVTGEFYGTHDELANKVLVYGSADEVKLAWRADPPYDHIANFMLSVLERDNLTDWNSGLRVQLRNFTGDMSTERACAIGAATEYPVVLVTRDSELEGQIAALCPDESTRVQLITE